MEDDQPPFTILSPTRVRLGKVAREYAREYGMTDVEFAKYLLQRKAQREQNGEN